MQNDSSVPVVGKTYIHYDDGKIKENRASKVKVTEVIPFENASKELVDKWNEVKEENRSYDSFLFDDTTDYFVKGIETETNTEFVYARSRWTYNEIVEGWFSFNDTPTWDSGRLDVEGNLMEIWWDFKCSIF